MLKRIFSNNRVFGAVVCVLVFIAAGLLYLQSANRDVARDVPPLRETVKPQQPPQGDNPSTGGHFDEDGTWHGEPHTTPVPPAEAQPIELPFSVETIEWNVLIPGGTDPKDLDPVAADALRRKLFTGMSDEEFYGYAVSQLPLHERSLAAQAKFLEKLARNPDLAEEWEALTKSYAAAERQHALVKKIWEEQKKKAGP